MPNNQPQNDPFAGLTVPLATPPANSAGGAPGATAIDPFDGLTQPAGAGAPITQTDAPGFFSSALDTAEKTVGSVGTHLKNLMAGPYHAFTDPLTDREKQQGMDSPILDNHVFRGAYRMLGEPTVNALDDAAQLRRAGGPRASLTAGSTYDDAGNNIPTAGSKLVDAIPWYGPWARGATDEGAKKGVIPELAGIATDALAPKFGAKGLAAGMSRVAPVLAETALGTRATDRAYGRTPGQAVLDETTGIRPGAITEQARMRVGDLTNELHSNASASPLRARLVGARDAAQDASDEAITRNSPISMKKTGQLLNQLTYEVDPNGGFATGDASTGAGARLLPNEVSPRHLLDLKRGINDLGKSWNPNTPSDLADSAVSRAYRLLDEEGDRTIPGGAELNNRISSLLPVMERARASDLNAGVLQRVVGRFAKPTGALAGGIAGAYLGGVPGAAFGLMAPEVLSSPTTLMAGARLLHGAAPIARTAARYSPYVTVAAANNPADQQDRFAFQRPRLLGAVQ